MFMLSPPQIMNGLSINVRLAFCFLSLVLTMNFELIQPPQNKSIYIWWTIIFSLRSAIKCRDGDDDEDHEEDDDDDDDDDDNDDDDNGDDHT